MQAAALAERDELLDDRAQVLRLRQRGDDLLVLDQRGRHVGEHRAAMLGRAVELAVYLAVAHQNSSTRRSGRARRARAGTHGHRAATAIMASGFAGLRPHPGTTAQ